MRTDKQKLIAIGIIVRDIRKTQKLTQAELGKRCGMAQSIISEVERTYNNSTMLTYFCIANGLGVTLASILRKADKL